MKPKMKVKRMLVTIFRNIDIKTRQEETSSSSQRKQGKKTLCIKNKKKEMLEDIEVKSMVREPKRLTSYAKNIASTLPDVSEAYGGQKGNKAPNSNRDRRIYHPWEELSKGGLPKR